MRERLIIDGEQLDANIAARVASVELVRTMNGASSIVTTIEDPFGELLTSGALTSAHRRFGSSGGTLPGSAWQRLGVARLTLDGVAFRLAGVKKIGTQLVLTFEDEIVALLRAHTRRVVFSRGEKTRAEVVQWFADEVKDRKIETVIPGLHVTRRIAGVDDDLKKGQARTGEKTLTHHKLLVGGAPATAEQKRNMEIALTEADSLNAAERPMLGMLCAGIGESKFRAIRNQGNPPSKYAGVFQADPANVKQDDTRGQAHYFLVGSKGFQAGGAIKLAASDSTLTPGTIATRVEASGEDGSFYDAFLNEAQAILDAWGGAGSVTVAREAYQYRRGGVDGTREDSYEAIDRLAAEVNYRYFATRNRLYFASDKDLLARGVVAVLSRPDRAVINVDFDWDYGKPTAECRVSAFTSLWTADAGDVIELDATYGPVAGRWLLWEIRTRDGDDQADITLRAGAPAKPEPAPSVKVTQSSPEEIAAGDPRDRIVKTAKKALDWARKGYVQYVYLTGKPSRPYPRTLFPTTSPDFQFNVGAPVVKTDCSGFVELVFKAAKCHDPSGFAYNGQGSTGTLASPPATPNHNPQPGDLVFFTPPYPFGHVGIYIGNGEMIQMGIHGVTRIAVKSEGLTVAGYYTPAGIDE